MHNVASDNDPDRTSNRVSQTVQPSRSPLAMLVMLLQLHPKAAESNNSEPRDVSDIFFSLSALPTSRLRFVLFSLN